MGDKSHKYRKNQVVLVTVPETTPVNELIETSYAVEERVGVKLGPVVVNQVDAATDLPDPRAVSFGRATAQVDDAIAAAEFRMARVGVQQGELARLLETVPLRQVHLAIRPSAGIGEDDVIALAGTLS
ncbi:MAG: hypothetical protein WKF60_12075, partial [Ilumatobacter sp.]